VTELSVLERVRAAVAEAGYDPTLIKGGSATRPRTFGWERNTVPDAVVWRAREAVNFGGPCCFQCWAEATYGRLVRREIDCLAVRRFVEDCGRDRTDP
jgi:hypothetical protein